MTLNTNSAHDGAKKRKSRKFSSTNENPTWKPPTLFKWSGHHIRFSWYLDGTPQRMVKKSVRMNGGWTRRYYDFKGASVVANVHTLDMWVATRKQKDPRKMLYEAWSRTDKLAREFAAWQKVAIRPIWSDHPANIQQAHLVLEDKKVSAALAPHANQPSAQEVGMRYDDSSHPEKIEFEGKDAVEGVFGADYIFKYFPHEFRALSKQIAQDKQLTQAELRTIAEALEVLLKRRKL